ncbi:MAG: 1-acyl-sn-glycerol-3-phosphate acyltransferase, partial [Candidatus Obscuribacterales bacterium]
ETLNLDASVQLDLGIDSLEWLTLQLAISDKTGVSFDESDILKISTVRDLMRVIAGKEGQQDIETRNLFESPEKLLNKGLKHWLEPLSGPERIIQYMLFSMIRLFVKTYLHLKVEGLSNIVADRQYVFIPNHASYLDAFVLGAAMPEGILRKTHWAGWTGIAFANDLARIGSRMGQVIPIDAENALISSLALPAAAIKSSKSLVWFPEGRRTLTGELLEFKKGIALLLNNCPVSVIPVFLKDTGSALPPGSWLLRPVTVTVRFGAPQEISALIKQGTGSSPEERIISAIKEQVQILSLENPSSSSLL